jgi:hypothetical protein
LTRSQRDNYREGKPIKWRTTLRQLPFQPDQKKLTTGSPGNRIDLSSKGATMVHHFGGGGRGGLKASFYPVKEARKGVETVPGLF